MCEAISSSKHFSSLSQATDHDGSPQQSDLCKHGTLQDRQEIKESLLPPLTMMLSVDLGKHMLDSLASPSI